MRSKPWYFLKSDEEMQAEQEQRRKREDADYELPQSRGNDLTTLKALFGAGGQPGGPFGDEMEGVDEEKGVVEDEFIKEEEVGDVGYEMDNNLSGLSIDELHNIFTQNTSTMKSNEQKILKLTDREIQLKNKAIQTLREDIIEQFQRMQKQEEELSSLEAIVGYKSQRTIERQKEEAAEDAEYEQITNPYFEENLDNMDKVRLDRDRLYIRIEDLSKIIKLRELRRKEGKEEELSELLKTLEEDDLLYLEDKNGSEINGNEEALTFLREKAKETLISKIQQQQKTLAEQQEKIAESEAKGIIE